MQSKVLEAIARENFRSSGYISHSANERRTSWISPKPSSSPIYTNDAVSGVLKRREIARNRQQQKTSFIKNCLNAFFQR